MTEKVEKIEENSFSANDFSEVPPQDIVAYNELRSCADLFRMYQQKILEIHPEFQREIVWPGPMQTRFIDSLIKQLPIPSMCFAYDYNKQKWIVIDGLQRIWTIVRFFKEENWQLATLDDIDHELSGKIVADIKKEGSQFHYFYTRVENLTIPVTVLRCDFAKKSHNDYLFTIFHRLNTGGMKLNNQEIRNCIYGGALNDLLRELDKNKDWRKLNRMKSTDSYRFIKQEMILRFFAFEERYDKYNGHLAKFLNDYMHDHQRADKQYIMKKRELFEQTVSVILTKVFSDNPIKKISVTHMEALLVGIGRNISTVKTLSADNMSKKYRQLQEHSVFSESSLSEGLSKSKNVSARLKTAIKIFRG